MNTSTETTKRISKLERELRKMKMESEGAVWISEKEAAEILNINHDTLRRLRREGKIKGARCRPSGRGYQYLKAAIENHFVRI